MAYGFKSHLSHQLPHGTSPVGVPLFDLLRRAKPAYTKVLLRKTLGAALAAG
ncbi:MAG: hypothetical protein FWD99_01860 [Oscillospiraceae bacterium]|nr:hypothetical protein [Oscillospiraceae bacterium]